MKLEISRERIRVLGPAIDPSGSELNCFGIKADLARPLRPDYHSSHIQILSLVHTSFIVIALSIRKS